MSMGAVSKPLSWSGKRWLVLGLVLLCILLSIQYTLKTSGAPDRSAFNRWLRQLRVMGQEDIWHDFNYPNPPIMALFLKGLAALPDVVGALCWFYLKVGMTFLAFFWVFRLLESSGRPFPFWAKVLTVLLSLRPIMGDLLHGNVNLFILFLVVATVYAYYRQRDWTAGFVLALGISCKVTPLLLVPYFLWKRAWKTLAGCGVGLVLFLVVVPSCFLGLKENNRDLYSWWEGMVKPFVVDGQVTTDHPNQSLPGLVFRLGSHSPSFYDKEGLPVRYDNLWDLPPGDLRWFVKGCMGVFALLVVWSCRTPTTPRRGWRLAAEFALITLGMLLFSERTWKHHCVTLLLPFAVLCYYLGVCRPGRQLRVYLIASLVAVAVLMATTSTTLVWVDHAAKMAQVYGAYVWANLILVTALVVILRRLEVPTTAAVSPSQPLVPVFADSSSLVEVS